MSKDEAPICPECGTEMLESNLDGTFTLDGSMDLSGYYCPNCSSQDDSNKN